MYAAARRVEAACVAIVARVRRRELIDEQEREAMAAYLSAQPEEVVTMEARLPQLKGEAMRRRHGEQGERAA